MNETLKSELEEEIRKQGHEVNRMLAELVRRAEQQGLSRLVVFTGMARVGIRGIAALGGVKTAKEVAGKMIKEVDDELRSPVQNQ